MRRKRKGKDLDKVSFWQSYSDMMAALLLVFILIIAVANYTQTITANKLEQQINQYEEATEENNTLTQQVDEDTKNLAAQQAQLAAQQATLDEQKKTLAAQQAELDTQKKTLEAQQKKLDEQQEKLDEQQATMTEQETELAEQAQTVTDQQAKLDEQEKTLAAQQTKLDEQEKTLATQQATLDEQAQTVETQQAKLDEQQETMDQQAESLNNIIGIRKELIEALKNEFEGSGLDISVDSETGAISFASNILFDYGESELKDSGKEFLDDFFPLYFDAILSDQFSNYIAEIIIEGHTDQHGSYLVNLELSQDRAYAVASYCLGDDSSMFSGDKLTEIRQLVTANGRASNDLVYKDEAKTEIDEDASRRVEIKFRLTEEEMIKEMSDILNGAE